MESIEIKLTYESLIALLQGKEFHLQTLENRFIFHPPFDGVFLTHRQLDEIKYQNQMGVFSILEKLSSYKEERK